MAFSTGTSIIWPSFKSETGERGVEISENAFATKLYITQKERAPASASRRRSRLQHACALAIPCPRNRATKIECAKLDQMSVLNNLLHIMYEVSVIYDIELYHTDMNGYEYLET